VRGSKLPRARLDAVEQRLAECASHHQVEREFAEAWSCSRRTVRRYVQAVYRIWAEQTAPLREGARERMRRAFEQHHQLCVARGDMRTAGMMLDRLARLDGAYAPERVELSGRAATAASLCTLTREKLQERIREIAARNPQLRALVLGEKLPDGSAKR
jgi:hypothetical protein